MIGKISRGLLRSSILKNQHRFTNFLDKANFVQGKFEAEVSPPLSQLNKNFYNPEYRYDTDDSDVMRLYTEKDNSSAEVTWTDVLDNAFVNVLFWLICSGSVLNGSTLSGSAHSCTSLSHNGLSITLMKRVLFHQSSEGNML
jgi:hypothetical protein